MYNEDEYEGEEDQIINEEYKLWKYNSRYLYDTLLIGAIEWPSLTISFLPSTEEDSSLKTYRILLGTHTSQTEQNYLLICKIKIPSSKSKKIDDETIENFYSPESINKYQKLENKIEIEYKINHQNEVNIARSMPQENLSNIIATKCPNGEIHIFDYLKHPKNPIDMQVKPEMKLLGHTKEGFGLNWSVLKEGFLLSGSDDYRICLWDINSNKNNVLKTFEGHKGIVEDVNFNKVSENIFCSCGDDKKLMIWDFRQEHPSFSIDAHCQEVNSVDFNPFNEYLLLTSSNDKTCALWDLRNLKSKLHIFKHHKNDVTGVKWNPNIMSILTSFSSDRRVNIWDLSNINKSFDDDGPSELLFTHGGHTSNVSDFDWNNDEELLCVSTSDDNIIQLWEMANYLYFKDNEDENINI